MKQRKLVFMIAVATVAVWVISTNFESTQPVGELVIIRQPPPAEQPAPAVPAVFYYDEGSAPILKKAEVLWRTSVPATTLVFALSAHLGRIATASSFNARNIWPRIRV